MPRTAAVNNAKAFQMDLQILQMNSKQKSSTQSKFRHCLRISTENASRLFTAEAQNDFTKFYDSLNVKFSSLMPSELNEKV